MYTCLHGGLIESFVRLMVKYRVPAPPDALLIAFEGEAEYNALQRLITINACERCADIRCQDRDGNNILHLICADIARTVHSCECDPIVVQALLKATTPGSATPRGSCPSTACSQCGMKESRTLRFHWRCIPSTWRRCMTFNGC